MYKKQVNDYILGKTLGKGQYGKVYEAVHIKTNQKVAIKQMKAYRSSEVEKMNEFTKNEIHNLKKLNKNPNIVKFLESFYQDKNLYMVYEHCNGGTLEEYLLERGPLDEE
jgi:serine/threonine-protein kinase ULK/ATG1